MQKNPGCNFASSYRLLFCTYLEQYKYVLDKDFSVLHTPDLIVSDQIKTLSIAFISVLISGLYVKYRTATLGNNIYFVLKFNEYLLWPSSEPFNMQLYN